MFRCKEVRNGHVYHQVGQLTEGLINTWNTWEVQGIYLAKEVPDSKVSGGS